MPNHHDHTETTIDGMLRTARIIPVLTIIDAGDAVPLARALVSGGFRMLEVTLRTPAAVESVRRICGEVPEAIVGLGTVLTQRDFALACSLEVPFAFSPGTTEMLLQEARRCSPDITFVPGIQTASELMQAMDAGFNTCKFFPANTAGGMAALAALAAPFPTARFCPTGGIDAAAAPAWLSRPNVLAVGGSWMATEIDVATRDWDGIRRRVESFLRSHLQ